MDLQL